MVHKIYKHTNSNFFQLASIFVVAAFFLGVTLYISGSNQQSKNPDSKAAETNQVLTSQASSYCQNPDTTVDKFIAPNGTDNSTCDINNPCQTLTHAVGVAVQNSTRHRIFARGGTYTNREDFTTYDGTQTLPIILCGKYNSEQATYQEPQQSPVETGSAFIHTVRPYYIISDFIVNGNGLDRASTTGQHGASGIMADANQDAWTGNHGHHAIIINNVVSNFWHDGISTPGADNGNASQVINNEVFTNNLENRPKDHLSSGWGSAIGAYKGANITIQGNSVHNNYGEGIGVSQSTGVLVSGNTVHDNYSVQIYVDSSHYVTVEKNFSYSTFDSTMYRCNSGCSCQPGSALATSGETGSVGDNTFRNNILTNTSTNLTYFNGGTATYMTNTKIYNNTIYNNTDSCKSNVSISSFAGDGNEIRDNIIAQPAGNSNNLITHDTINSQPTWQTYTFSNNAWYGGGGIHPNGSGDITVNPLLNSPITLPTPGVPNSPDNYRVQASSPAIDHALALAQVINDYWNVNRPQGSAPDIGADEFTSSPQVTATPAPVSPTPTSTVPTATPTVTPRPTATPFPTATPYPTVTTSVLPTPATVSPTPTEGPFTANYYNDYKSGNQWVHLSRLALTRYDSAINFSGTNSWGYGSPDPSVNADHFSAQWSKQTYMTTGTYQFATAHDDGARIYLDGNLVYSKWSNQSAYTRYFNVNITTTGWHTLVVQYYENTGNASIYVTWNHL